MALTLLEAAKNVAKLGARTVGARGTPKIDKPLFDALCELELAIEQEEIERAYQRAEAELDAARKEAERVGYTPEALTRLRKAERNFDMASFESGHG